MCPVGSIKLAILKCILCEFLCQTIWTKHSVLVSGPDCYDSITIDSLRGWHFNKPDGSVQPSPHIYYLICTVSELKLNFLFIVWRS